MSFHRVSPVTQSHHPGGPGVPNRSGFGPPPRLILLPSIIMPVRYYGICAEKELCEHPISNQQNQHNLSQWIIPKPSLPPSPTPPSTSHAGLLHHPIYIFIGQLSPSLPSLSGSRALSNRGNLSHSLIERLSGDYGEVRNKVVLRNHKHKPFLSLCWGILFFLQQLFIIAGGFFSLRAEELISPPWIL